VARRYERGLRITEIAEELRRNAATVRVQLFRIRQALKLCVEGQLARGMGT
jgi:DNA-directed RNA polymerase specialized sigma24 family protein